MYGNHMISESQAKADGLKLVARSMVAMLGTVGKDGFPEIRAMLKTGNDDLKTVWFSTKHVFPESPADPG
jgi:general stress protein 26